jgi:hypothetical protein
MELKAEVLRLKDESYPQITQIAADFIKYLAIDAH